MIAAPLPADEPGRLAALHSLQVLDTLPEPAFDALVQTAALVCAVPVVLLSLVDADRQWFKAGIGMDGLCETPRAVAFCSHALLADGLLEVPDARSDFRFAANPLVSCPDGIRFYGGVPVRLPDGHAVGTLCVIDRVERTLDHRQRATLQALALMAGHLLDGRRALLEAAARNDLELERRLEEATREAEDLYENAPCAYYSLDQQGRFIRINRHAREWLGCTREEVLDRLGPRDFLSEQTQSVFRQFFPVLLAQGHVDGIEAEYVSRNGTRRWVSINASVLRDADGAFLSTRTALFDISARRAAEQALAEANERQRVTMDSIGDAVITIDPQGTVVWLNPVASALTGWTRAEATGLPLGEVFRIVHESTGEPADDPVARCLRENRVVGLAKHTALVSRQGLNIGIEDSAAPIRNAEGVILGAVLVFRDVSEARRLSQEMRHRATHDPLTGLVNRAEFEARLARLLGDIKSASAGVHAVMFIDLDQFKLVNDTCGHAVGDQLLRQVTTLLQASIRSSDTLARLGGDEFGVILTQCSAEQAARVGQKICDRMEAYRFIHEEHRFRIGTSIGLVEMDGSWPGVAALQQAADSACYRAKHAGRNRVHRFDNSDHVIRERQGDIQWVQRLEEAMERNQFVLFGQRIAALQGPVSGLHCEVLLRLEDGHGGLVPPATFIPAAERHHLAARLDRWVVGQVFRKLGTLGPQLGDLDLVSINLSGQSVADRVFHGHLLDLVRGARFDVHKLCFEITETAAITNFVEVRPFIEELRDLGARVALDDFGAGASSFAYLKSLPVDFLKIDGHFITRLLEDPLDLTAVECFQRVAQVVGVRTIAEFVEREDVRARLCSIGIDFAQGYLVHRPEPLDNLLRRAGPPDDLQPGPLAS